MCRSHLNRFLTHAGLTGLGGQLEAGSGCGGSRSPRNFLKRQPLPCSLQCRLSPLPSPSPHLSVSLSVHPAECGPLAPHGPSVTLLARELRTQIPQEVPPEPRGVCRLGRVVRWGRGRGRGPGRQGEASPASPSPVGSRLASRCDPGLKAGRELTRTLVRGEAQGERFSIRTENAVSGR